MKTKIIDNQTFIISESWNEITLEKQINVERYAKRYPEIQIVNIIAGYLGLEVENVKRLHIQTIHQLIEELSFLQTPMLKDKPVSSFEHHGKKYDVIPSLLSAEFQDFISIEMIREQYKDNLYASLPILIAILAKQEGESLSDYDVMARSREFNDLPLPIANSLHTFFLLNAMLWSRDYKQLIQGQNQSIQESINSILNTVKKQDGKGLLGRLQMKIFSVYLKYIRYRWNKLSKPFISNH